MKKEVKNQLEKDFFKKKHGCSFIFSKLCYTPILLIIHIFFNWNHSSMDIFSIYIYACPVKYIVISSAQIAYISEINHGWQCLKIVFIRSDEP